MKTAMQELHKHFIDAWSSPCDYWNPGKVIDKVESMIEKEKEQLIAAVRYGQNNHTENVYEEGELYYNEIYNIDTQFIKSSIPNGNIEITKTNNL